MNIINTIIAIKSYKETKEDEIIKKSKGICIILTNYAFNNDYRCSNQNIKTPEEAKTGIPNLSEPETNSNNS